MIKLLMLSIMIQHTIDVPLFIPKTVMSSGWPFFDIPFVES